MTNGIVDLAVVFDRSIEHWEKNLKIVKRIPWGLWQNHIKRLGAGPLWDGYFLIYDSDFETIKIELPHIFANACPFCRHFNDNCKACPLKDSNDQCCDQYYRVFKALKNYPTPRFVAIHRIKKLIRFIKKKKDIYLIRMENI